MQADLPENPVIMRGDPDHIWQVLLNILLNSLQASESGSIIVLSLDVGDKYITLKVKDSGKGIEENKIGEIFTPFYSTREEGTGLGLAIVKRIAEENGWDIEVESKKGEGTVFSIVMYLDEREK